MPLSSRGFRLFSGFRNLRQSMTQLLVGSCLEDPKTLRLPVSPYPLNSGGNNFTP